jgi:hypothetical protein
MPAPRHDMPMPRSRPSTEDPPPAAPERPLPGDCCRSGCNPCVFDLYQDALERYRAQLAAWEARHRPAPGADD